MVAVIWLPEPHVWSRSLDPSIISKIMHCTLLTQTYFGSLDPKTLHRTVSNNVTYDDSSQASDTRKNHKIVLMFLPSKLYIPIPILVHVYDFKS